MAGTNWPGIYSRMTRSSLVFDAIATAGGKQKQSRGHRTPALALKAKRRLREELRPGIGEPKPVRRHGLMKTPEYTAWHNMIQRCTNPKHPFWADYGGRGITVCERWREFLAFYEDMGTRPAGLTLERIDNDAGYEPSNCCWATLLAQARNKRPRKRAEATLSTRLPN